MQGSQSVRRNEDEPADDREGASSLRNSYKTSEESAIFVQHHFDRAYADGFTAGMRDQAADTYINDSTTAWSQSGRVDDFAGWRQ